MKRKYLFLRIILSILFLVFCLSVFKNISYPLLWNDESETVMFGNRVLNYGYPKVHDGKNIIYQVFYPDYNLGLNVKTDAYIVSGWLQYYFSTIGILLTHLTDDIYLKTALIRLPFAVIALVGLIILSLTTIRLINGKKKKLLYLILFTFFEICSMFLTLHIREARYYSLTIFLISIIFTLYIKYYWLKNLDSKKFILLSTIFLFLLFNTFFPAFLIVILSFFVYEIYKYLSFSFKNKSLVVAIIPTLKNILIFLPAIISVIPLIFLFNTFKISAALSEFKNFTFLIYFSNLKEALLFFYHWEFLYLAIILKITLVFLRGVYKKIDQKNQFSNLLSIFFIIYFLIISKSPYYFERYLIIIQPVVIIILLLDFFSIIELISVNIKRLIVYKLFIVFFVIAAGFGIFIKFDDLKNHYYEITHQYKGPLDYVIPYLIDKYNNTENLIIATNYEEFSYMYYLKSKVIIGYIPTNLKADLKEQPDVIIFRKLREGNPNIFNYFLNQATYEKVAFPVYDYNVNNIPESCCHLFKTKLAKDANLNLDIYIKK